MLNLAACVPLSTVAAEVAHQYGDEAVLGFLAELDEKMASWEFTQGAASLFTKALNGLNDHDGDPRGQALANLTEFVRQMGLNPKKKVDSEFYSAWTDPAAQPVSLRLDDLEILLELAALGLKRVGE